MFSLKEAIQTLEYNLDRHNIGSVKRCLEFMLWRTNNEIDKNFELNLEKKSNKEDW